MLEVGDAVGILNDGPIKVGDYQAPWFTVSKLFKNFLFEYVFAESLLAISGVVEDAVYLDD